MNFTLHFRRLVVAALLSLAAITVLAQVATPPIPNPNLNLNPNPPLPIPISYKTVAPGVTLRISPVLYFRGILGMTPAERERALANKPAASKKALLDKVEEYQRLPADIREARLRQTQLRWELTSLTNLAPAARPAFIKEVAPEDRPLLEDFNRWQTSSPDERAKIISALSPNRHQALTQALAQWESVPESERQQRSDQFRQFCDLDPTQQQKALTAFSDDERRTMEAALKKFAGLPEAQRKICIQSFQKFATMNDAERDEFLQNAARWETLAAADRSLWRTLVQTYPIVLPPMPPGLRPVQFPPMPPGMILPPMPPGMKPPGLSTASAKPAAAANSMR